MQFLDRTGVGTLWSMCKTKFALAGHTHNSLAAVGNEQISATAYGSGLHFKPYYNSSGPTTYGNILEYTSTNTGGGQLAMEWTGSQTKSDGTDSNVGRVYYRSKRDCINGWTKWMTLAYTNDIPTKLSQLTNDKGFVTGSVSGNTITINGASTTWTNTWRGIQDNLTSTSTSESLSANQGRILKGLVDGKANSSHTHNYAGSGSPGGSANSAIGVVDYNQTSKIIQIGYSRAGITGDQIKYIAGYTDGSGNVNAKIKDVSKDALKSWLGLGSLAYSSSSIPTNLSQLNNDKGFVTGSVSGNTITINGVSTTWTNTWRGIQDNLTSYSTSDSLSANQGRILKGLVDSKANSNEVIKSVRVQLYGDTINGFTPNIVVTDNANQEQSFTINKANGSTNGLMSFKDKNKLDLIPDNLSDLCRFNFVNSVSECRSDRINFLLGYPDYMIDLSDFDDYPDGTILLITINENSIPIKHQSGSWYSDGDSINRNGTIYTYKGEINLITKNNGTVHHYSFN